MVDYNDNDLNTVQHCLDLDDDYMVLKLDYGEKAEVVEEDEQDDEQDDEESWQNREQGHDAPRSSRYAARRSPAGFRLESRLSSKRFNLVGETTRCP